VHERVARDKPGREARFIFVTAGTYTVRARDYLAHIPNRCFTKPLEIAALRAAIERVAAG
jgi:hypothetical protein